MRRGSLTTSPTGRAALTQNTSSTTLPPRVASSTKFSTTTSIGREQVSNLLVRNITAGQG